MSEAKNDGGPAFPVQTQSVQERGVLTHETVGGLSMRDYFAIKALQGLLACNNDDDYEEETQKRNDYAAYCDNFAESAYDMADAMLRARQK